MPRHSAPQRPSWLRPRFVVAFVVATAGLVTAVWLPTRNDSADAAERNRSTDSRRSRSLPAFADDFTGARGSTVDPVKWGLRTDRVGYGMQFSQDTRNVRLDGEGNLEIVLREEERNAFSTARLFSRGTLRGTSGRVEARVKAPEGEGLQPAVELVGVTQPNAGSLNLLAEPVTDGEFHTYAVDWTPSEVVLSVDGQQVDRRAGQQSGQTVRQAGQFGQQVPAGFDTGQPFKLAVSLAVKNDRNRADLPGRLTVDSINFSGADASAEPTEPPATEPTSPPASDPTPEPSTSDSPSPEPSATEPPASEPTSPPAPTTPTSPPTSAPAAEKWAPFTDYVAGQLVTYKGVRYQVQETHTSLPGWEPTALPALFKKI
ncbi:hypothetical protein DMB66_40160 [Actinoplanes sp. ATCC 53533]|uniref:carbohydrate-binding protein n=1 Tax=Actinoplanes sp. ATCC 53533 TaxID=1288362 RepID=UPI000F7B18B7|nr:carbohydrate-binding protein [Actinoplanes sp. ATCC 53533]RSM52405.1 hypothetical protein DMB66_40160 [Actinoplanes sp. ATCC 53533]